MSCCTSWPRELNPVLHDFYKRKLLVPGWGGSELDHVELDYIKERLYTDPRLAYSWGFAPSQKTRPEAAIRRITADGHPQRREANLRLARPRKASFHGRSATEVASGRGNSDFKGTKAERKSPRRGWAPEK